MKYQIDFKKVSEQLIETNAINKSYHQALDHQRVKVESLEEQNHKALRGFLHKTNKLLYHK